MREIKQMMALATLAVCAYTDIKEKSIYLMPLAVASAGAVAVTLTDFFFTPCGEGVHILVDDLLIPFAAGIVMILLTRLKSFRFGEGDGYMLACLGFLVGIRSDLYSFAAGLVAAALYSAILLVSKKGQMKTIIPFAPFVLTGFLFTVINGI